MTLDKAGGIAAAATFLAQESRRWQRQDVKVMADFAFMEGGILLVPWNTVALVDHGIEDAELAGNLPIRVDLETGRCEYIDLVEMFDYIDRGFMS